LSTEGVYSRDTGRGNSREGEAGGVRLAPPAPCPLREGALAPAAARGRLLESFESRFIASRAASAAGAACHPAAHGGAGGEHLI
jgi:hypothetical protein